MSSRLSQVRGASLPVSALESLADLRADRGLFVLIRETRAWLRWDRNDDALVLRLMALADTQLYDRRDGIWYAHAQHLPSFDVPLDSDDLVVIHRAILPRPLEPQPAAPLPIEPVHLRLVRQRGFQPTSAARYRLRAFAQWSDSVSSQRLAQFSAALVGRTILVLGENLPILSASRRYWGKRVLTPIGYRPEPALRDSVIRRALGIGAADLLLLQRDGYDVVPSSAIVAPMTRASLRVARQRTSG